MSTKEAPNASPAPVGVASEFHMCEAECIIQMIGKLKLNWLPCHTATNKASFDVP
jgi:hypothetical protein